MTYFSIIVLAIALSIDACIVSFSYGLKYDKQRLKNAMLLASFTGAFQAIMPVFGYFLTNFVRGYIQPYANIIVFLIFTYLGVKFIFEAYEKEKPKSLCIDLKCLTLIGIATSIDAFSAGISLSLYGNRILKPALLIGLVTFLNSNLGFFFGGKLKNNPSKILEIIGGIILILLGLKAII